ncbi:MAG TPA: peptide chain release factor N(5)-glutamine methyltransferase [Candidatus Fimimorpha excrementavium]|nr:peptide chain release factor N(5)-glutamine methyltransferase [Candidatus Fimimorpha excrementavium]
MDLKRSYEELLKEGARRLKQAGIAEYDLDAWYLMEECFSMDRVYYLIHKKDPVTQDEEILQDYFEKIKKRAERIPLQHIIGTQEFMGFSFAVNEHVLIPRQDTEILVETILEEQKRKDISVLDMCTGSGCIAISLALLGHYEHVEGTDLSLQAIAVARQNNDSLHAGVEFYTGDLFEHAKGTYDVIVSNPPYIRKEVIETLEPEVKDHEPYQALYGPENGLYFYRAISREAKKRLRPGGSLYFEIGYDQAESVSEILKGEGFHGIRVRNDLAGLNRVVMGNI